MASHTSARPSPYAPPSATIPQVLSSSISLDEEVKLHNSTPAQRRVWDDLATIYSIIVSLEFVEKAYVRDTITQAQYTQKCSNLLTQYKAILKDAEVQERFGDLETFQKEYNVQFTSATYRLKVGVPATVEHAGSHHHITNPSEASSEQVNARHIAETVEKFITFMDALKLSYKSKDQLHPLLSELMTSLNTSMPKDFDGRAKIVQWLITLNQMRAADELSDDQSRQMLFDIETAYNQFFNAIGR